MKRPTRWLALFVTLLCCLLVVGGALAQGSMPAINWWVIAGSGGPSSGGGVSLNDTLGQPVIGPSSSGNVSLAAGYWYSTSTTYTVYLPMVVRNG